VLKEKLERIQQEVRNVALMQRHSEELEQTRQRASKMESTIQIQQKETQEAREQREELCIQLAEKDRRVHEVEQRLREAAEEGARTKQELAQAVRDFNSAISSKERLEEEQRGNRYHQEQTETLRQRCEELERTEQDLLEQVQHVGSQRHALESQVAEAVRSCEELGGRLGTATEAARRLEGEKRLLESELERVRQQQRDSEQETRDLRCRTALLEEQLREMQEHKQSVEQEQKGAEQELRQWYQKCLDAERGSAGVQRQNQELRRDLWDLGVQMQQERNAANITSPGEYLSLMKAHEGESLAADHGKLKKQLSKTQCELELCIRKLDEQEKLIRTYQCATKH
jgi:chromosome segregation ATPase